LDALSPRIGITNAAIVQPAPKQQPTDQQIAEIIVQESREAPAGEIARYRAAH